MGEKVGRGGREKSSKRGGGRRWKWGREGKEGEEKEEEGVKEFLAYISANKLSLSLSSAGNAGQWEGLQEGHVIFEKRDPIREEFGLGDITQVFTPVSTTTSGRGKRDEDKPHREATAPKKGKSSPQITQGA